MEYSYKFRLYPNQMQKNQIERTFGCCRFVYNHFLAMRKQAYEETKETLNFFACCKEIPILKKQYDWLSEVDSTALQSAVRDLDTAYQNFFRRMKRCMKPFGYPLFKSKKSNHQSYKSKCVGTNIKIADEKHIQLPKLGKVKCAISKQVQGRILNATVSRTPSGEYFVALCCTDVAIAPVLKTGAVVGVDLGIKDLAITSDGKKYVNNKYTYQAEKQLARLQRSLSRKSKGSKNRNKARIKVARLQEKVANRRKDTLHKVTTELVRNYDVVCIEDLNAKGMEKNHHLAKSVADASFGEFRRQLEYKAAWCGKRISVIDRFYPSSQLCSCCGTQWAGTKELSVRKWTCPKCGAIHDRDVNAAKNILNEGIRLLA